MKIRCELNVVRTVTRNQLHYRSAFSHHGTPDCRILHGLEIGCNHWLFVSSIEMNGPECISEGIAFAGGVEDGLGFQVNVEELVDFKAAFGELLGRRGDGVERMLCVESVEVEMGVAVAPGFDDES